MARARRPRIASNRSGGERPAHHPIRPIKVSRMETRRRLGEEQPTQHDGYLIAMRQALLTQPLVLAVVDPRHDAVGECLVSHFVPFLSVGEPVRSPMMRSPSRRLTEERTSPRGAARCRNWAPEPIQQRAGRRDGAQCLQSTHGRRPPAGYIRRWKTRATESKIASRGFDKT